MMNKDERLKRLEEIDAEKELVNQRVQEISDSIRNAFAARKREKSIRELSGETGLSIGSLSTWLQGSSEPETEAERRTDGPRMINVISVAKSLDVDLPGALTFNVNDGMESLLDYDSSPEAWNVFVHNMKAVKRVVLMQESTVLREVGGVAREESHKRSESTRQKIGIRDNAKAVSKYYRRIVERDAGKKSKIRNLDVDSLAGNPFCELKTIVTVLNRLNPGQNIGRWFQRWSPKDIICDAPVEIIRCDLYDDEMAKLQMVAPYVVAGTQDLMASVRVGSPEDMIEEYSREPQEQSLARGRRRFVIELDKGCLIRGTCAEGGIRTDSWDELFAKGFVKEGDFLVAFAAMKKLFGLPQVVVLNLTRKSAEEIQKQLDRTIRQDSYRSILAKHVDHSRQYLLYPDGETLEQFHTNDWLDLYHTDDETSYRGFNRFHVNPDRIAKEAEGLLEQDQLRENEGMVKELLKKARGNVDVIPEVAWVLPDGTRIEVETAEMKDERENERLERLEKWRSELSVFIVRFGAYTYRKWFLNADSFRSVISLDLNTGDEITAGDYGQHFPKIETVASWSMEKVAAGLANRVGKILAAKGWSEESIEQYKGRIRKQGVGELIKSNRLWLEVLFPTHGEGRIQWYWHFNYKLPVKKA
ncbi:MAG: hypothetical protein J6Y67_02520 [Lachnospiraceae bacterium]|nr:hypothetical protein [Lachnospiraceae bacterium]